MRQKIRYTINVSKLNVYNFTIFDNYKKEGFSYLWDELNGKKGSNEIGTSLYEYLRGLPSHVTHVSTFSDTCGGQNRNRNIAAAMIYAVSMIENIQTIDVKFMESGHSYLDADSMHARIEECRKHRRIYTTREYALVIENARIKPKPYCVRCMEYSQFYDWKAMSKSVLKNVNTAGCDTSTDDPKKVRTVEWLKIKWLRFEKSRSGIIQFKYDLNAKDFFFFDVTYSHGATTRTSPSTNSNFTLPPCSARTNQKYRFRIKKKEGFVRFVESSNHTY